MIFGAPGNPPGGPSGLAKLARQLELQAWLRLAVVWFRVQAGAAPSRCHT